MADEPVQRDPKESPHALCNAPELDEECPRCKSGPGYLCRYTHATGVVGCEMPTFHRARTVLTFRASHG